LERLPYGMCLWAAGNAPHDLAQDIIGQVQSNVTRGARPGRGARIVTDAWLRVVGVGDGSAFAAGDCAEPETGALPQTAMTASQQGEYIARVLNAAPALSAAPAAPAAPVAPAALFGRAVGGRLAAAAAGGDGVARAVVERGARVESPFQLVYLGILAYVGGNRAVAQVRLGLQDVEGQGEAAGVDWGGWAAWILWRSVYIVKQISLRNRVRARGAPALHSTPRMLGAQGPRRGFEGRGLAADGGVGTGVTTEALHSTAPLFTT
jgi:NADH:ubiquinone reductase (non-electrogenic)